MNGTKIITGIKDSKAVTFQDLLDGKVKLEFGNPEHIKLIDEEQELMNRVRDNDLVVEDDEILKEYEVEYAIAGTALVCVEAFTEEEARFKADDARGWGDVDDVDYDYLSTRLIGRA